MSLIFPTPGEIFDRLGILELKLHCAREKNKPSGHFISEKEDLKKYYDVNFSGVNSPNCSMLALQAKIEELDVTNAMLWNLEDERRKLMKDVAVDQSYFEIGRNAEKTTLLNDKRAQLIKEINLLFGITGEEKLYDQ